MKKRIEDKYVFKNVSTEGGRKGHGKQISNASSPLRPLSEPTTGGISKKGNNFRIKNKVLKR